MMVYCNEKYGADKVAQIITFGTMGARGAIRDVGRVMNVPLPEVDRVAKIIPGPQQGKTPSIAETLEKSPELRAVYESSEQMKKLLHRQPHGRRHPRRHPPQASSSVISPSRNTCRCTADQGRDLPLSR